MRIRQMGASILLVGGMLLFASASQAQTMSGTPSKRDVRVVSVTQQIDLSGTVGHLIASLLFGIAEMELQHAKERHAIGIALARQRGVYKGRRAGTTKATPSRAQALKQQGLTIPEISNALGVSPRTVFSYLRRPPVPYR